MSVTARPLRRHPDARPAHGAEETGSSRGSRRGGEQQVHHQTSGDEHDVDEEVPLTGIGGEVNAVGGELHAVDARCEPG